MKARIIILGRVPGLEPDTFGDILKKTFSGVLADQSPVEHFAALKDATASIGRAFTDSDTIMFFSTLPKYAETKEILCKALGLELTVDEDILSGALKTASQKEQEADYLYAGFAAKRGRQTVMLLPLDESRATVMLGTLVIPYMNERLGAGLKTEPLQYYYGEKLLACVKREKIKIAIAGTKPAEIFMKYVGFSDELSKRVLYVNKAENRGNMPPNEYVVNLSITAAEFMGVPYGIAISNAYYSGDDPSGVKTVYITVTNDAETTVREIRSFYGENTGEFLFRCCSEQCRLLTEIIDTDAGLIKKEEPENKKNSGGGKYKALIAVLAALILLVCGAGGYYFHSHSYTLKDWAQSYLSFLPSSEKDSESSSSSPESSSSSPSDAQSEAQTDETAENG